MDAQLNFGTVFSKWLPKYGRRRALRRAAARAHGKFAKRYAEYAAALFDEHFLANRAANLLERYITSENPPKAVELASAWAEQIHMSGGTKRALVSELTAAASDFLFMFETEVIGRDLVGKMAPQSQRLF